MTEKQIHFLEKNNMFMSREEFLKDKDKIYVEEDEYLTEMATIARNRDYDMRITVNPDRNRVGVPYFKVFNHINYDDDVVVARFHFKDSGMEYHRCKYKDWHVSNNNIKEIKKLLLLPYDEVPKYNNWQMTCYKWNIEYGFDIKDKEEYFNGDCDDKFSYHPSYVPSICEMPEMWIYDPPIKK